MNIEITAENLATLDDHGMIPQGVKESYKRKWTDFDPIQRCRIMRRGKESLKRIEVTGMVLICLCLVASVPFRYLHFKGVIIHSTFIVMVLAVIVCAMRFIYAECIRDRLTLTDAPYAFATGLARLVENSYLSPQLLCTMTVEELANEVEHILTRLGHIQAFEQDQKDSWSAKRNVATADQNFKDFMTSMEYLGFIPEGRTLHRYFPEKKKANTRRA